MKSIPTFPIQATPIQAASASQRGMTLIEVLIAVLILGIGMLGIAAMQAAALRDGQGSLQQSQAVIMANTMMDAMRANATVANAGSYNLAMAASPCKPPANAGSVMTSDQNWWITNLQSSIGSSACGSIACANGICTIVVQWSNNLQTAPTSVSIASRL